MTDPPPTSFNTLHKTNNIGVLRGWGQGMGWGEGWFGNEEILNNLLEKGFGSDGLREKNNK